ncbi:MAG: metallopeptidase family protein [Candidatus Eisenbacteria bacterium]
MFGLNDEEFRQVVTEAIEALPDEFKAKLDNVDVVVDDYPPPDALRRLPRGRLLLGLYQGVPQKRRTTHYGLVLPDKITLFKRNIESICRSREQVYGQIRKTLLHEIGHHFSLSDKDLRDIGW